MTGAKSTTETPQPRLGVAARGRGVRVDDEDARRIERFEWVQSLEPTEGFLPFISDGRWVSAPAPVTVLSAARAASDRGDEIAGRDVAFDDAEHLFRAGFRGTGRTDGRTFLYLPGLATRAEVWLNGKRLLVTNNMFTGDSVDITDSLSEDNLLGIRIHPLGLESTPRRPRQRWRTQLSDARLRFIRTTLLGRMPGFCPPTPPVGPFRPIDHVHCPTLTVESVALSCQLDGLRGIAEASVVLREASAESIDAATLAVGPADSTAKLERTSEGAVVARATVVIDDVEPWWPHTHGKPTRYPAVLTVETTRGPRRVELGHVGFREILPPAGSRPGPDGSWPDIKLQINGVAVFCRGGCWMPLDLGGPHQTRSAYREALVQLKDAGMNMVRVPGTCLYEADDFYDLCDELGILVWQDFMLARFDYPEGDASFAEAFDAEAKELLGRLDYRPSLAVLCGGSEIEQQAAMFGLTPDRYQSKLLSETLPVLVAERRPDVPYVRGSPSGGVLPMDVSTGVSHYFGVGAYERPLSDARERPPRFATEALAFACFPETSSLAVGTTDPARILRDPTLKDRIPQDPGTDWTFADTTDFYIRELFGVEPAALREHNPARYLELARVTPGETMAATFSTLRLEASPCSGLLIWLWRDPWIAPGFGVIDALGRPKAAYYYLRRACGATAVLFEDAGLDGLGIHVVHDGPEPLGGTLAFSLYRNDGLCLETHESPVHALAHDATSLRAESLVGRFFDSTYSYRFGPPIYDVAVARLYDASGAMLSEAFYRPTGLRAMEPTELGASATRKDDHVELRIETPRYAHAVHIEAEGAQPLDNYFHMAPQTTRTVRLDGIGGDLPASVTIKAVNSDPLAIPTGE